LELRLEEGAPKERIDKVLSRRFGELTRETIKRWILEGRVTVEGRAVRPKDRVGGGALILVEPGSAPLSDAAPDKTVRFAVVYDDDELLVVDKPAGLVVHPARGHRQGTLVNGLLTLPGFSAPPADPRDPDGHLRPGIVHRIDRDTSGLLVVAKTERAREGLKEQLSRHTMQRRYEALTWGVPREGRIETLHGRDPRNRLKFSVDVQEGKSAVTLVEVLETFFAGRAARVSCRLETGRTHQIRVHLAQVQKTPLLADALYGGFKSAPEVLEIERALGRQALHAAELGFTHPASGVRLHFTRPLPRDLEATLDRLRAL
jgi:23S rRNA pseudouridine1911/1915/1917 synthase